MPSGAGADAGAMQDIGATLPPPVSTVTIAAPVLHASFVKSGSYFLWQTLDALFRACGEKRSYVQRHPIQRLRGTWPDFSIDQFDIDQILVQDDGVHWQIETQHIEPIHDLDAYLAACSHVWTHSFLCVRSWEVYSRFARVCYIVRDPRDALASMAHFVMTPFMRRYHPHSAQSPADYVAAELDSFLGDWCRHAGDHWHARRALGIEFLHYERMVHDLPAALRGLADWLGLPLGESASHAIAGQLGVETMRQRNPQHVRKGGSGGFRELLSQSQQERALAICGPTMRLVGYDV
jgi:aryl sulfotransferase